MQPKLANPGSFTGLHSCNIQGVVLVSHNAQAGVAQQRKIWILSGLIPSSNTCPSKPARWQLVASASPAFHG